MERVDAELTKHEKGRVNRAKVGKHSFPCFPLPILPSPYNLLVPHHT